MKKTLLAITSALILTGAMSSTASAQSGYYDRDDNYSYDAYDDRDDDRDDDRYDDRYSDSRYSDSRYGDSRDDFDRDGISDQYDTYDNRNNISWDRNRDGRNDRYQAANDDHDGHYDSRDGRYDNRYNDNRYERGDNRYDRRDNRRGMAQRRYQAGRYYAPRGYRYVRYDIGSRLPQGYYGSNHYVDYRPYGLSAPPRGYRWNRVGSDAYLVSITNGVVRQVMYSLFY